tara:strand:- start:358 stop:1392 length:1035 start_codon:yes stop_codon:yes gene_type:complete
MPSVSPGLYSDYGIYSDSAYAPSTDSSSTLPEATFGGAAPDTAPRDGAPAPSYSFPDEFETMGEVMTAPEATPISPGTGPGTGFDIPTGDSAIPTFSGEMILDERLALIPSLASSNPALTVLTGRKISDYTRANNGVIPKSAMLGPSGVYGFERTETLDPSEFVLLLDDAAALTKSVSINALALYSVYNDPSTGVWDTRFVDIFYTAGASAPSPALSLPEESEYWHYSLPYNPYPPGVWFSPERTAIIAKFGYDAVTFDAHPYNGTLERLDLAMTNIIDDLATGVMQRLDLSKTTKKLDFTKELFENIIDDEAIEGFTPTTSAPTTTTVVSTVSTTPASPGGTY